MNDRHPKVRYYAIIAIGDMKDVASRGLLETLSRGGGVSRRVVVAEALYKLTDDPKYLNRLGRFLLKAPTWHDRYGVLHALDSAMRRRDIPVVIRWLKDALRREKESPGLRKDLRRLIARLKPSAR